MLRFFKTLASRLPARWQQGLRRNWYAHKLRRGTFTHDEPEYLQLAQWVKPGDQVIDVGANLGVYTAALSRLVGPTGHVYAFEPIPETFSLLSSNAESFAHANITLFNVAASNQAGLVSMEVPASDSGLPDIYQARIIESPNGRQIFAIPLNALQIPGPISFVKIDVEGHELKVLEGMTELLRSYHPRLVVEDSSDPEVTNFLVPLGYRASKTPDSPNLVFEFEE